MSDIQQEIREDNKKLPEDYSEAVDWYTEIATSAPVTAGEMIVNLRARVQELEEVAQTVVDVIDGVEIRCMAVDGPVTPTHEEITDDELRSIYHPAARALTRAGEVRDD